MDSYLLYPLFIAILLFGFYFFWSDRKRQERLQSLLNTTQDPNALSKDDLSEQNIASVEKLLRKSSKVITFSALLDKNVMAKAIVVITVTIILILANKLQLIEFSTTTIGMIVMVVMICVIILPNIIKNKAIAGRIKRISNDLPFIIDMMAVCVQSGMTIEKSMRYLADNTGNINTDIAALLDRAMMKAEVSGIASALDLLYEEVPSAEVRMFCSTLQQSIKYGSSVYTVLLELSKEIREMQLLQTEEKISSLAAKMTIPMILFIMMPILAMVAGPGMVRMASLWGGMS